MISLVNELCTVLLQTSKDVCPPTVLHRSCLESEVHITTTTLPGILDGSQWNAGSGSVPSSLMWAGDQARFLGEWVGVRPAEREAEELWILRSSEAGTMRCLRGLITHLDWFSTRLQGPQQPLEFQQLLQILMIFYHSSGIDSGKCYPSIVRLSFKRIEQKYICTYICMDMESQW